MFLALWSLVQKGNSSNIVWRTKRKVLHRTFSQRMNTKEKKKTNHKKGTSTAKKVGAYSWYSSSRFFLDGRIKGIHLPTGINKLARALEISRLCEYIRMRFSADVSFVPPTPSFWLRGLRECLLSRLVYFCVISWIARLSLLRVGVVATWENRWWCRQASVILVGLFHVVTLVFDLCIAIMFVLERLGCLI